MDLDLDFNALFFEYPTVKNLKDLLGDSGVSTIPIKAAVDTSRSGTSGSALPSSPAPKFTGTTTLDYGSGIEFRHVLAIISEETGVATEDFAIDTSFADNGIDSLLSLVIVTRLRDEFEPDISHETLFFECPTVRDLKVLIEGDAAGSEDMSLAPFAERKPQLTPDPVPAPAPVHKLADAGTRTETEMASLTTRMKAIE